MYPIASNPTCTARILMTVRPVPARAVIAICLNQTGMSRGQRREQMRHGVIGFCSFIALCVGGGSSCWCLAIANSVRS
ncbi:unnamed protein product [Protopolystoma xenopodis]|uniref:Uncharacterized protein n=1 Tax=Protopolystoma xenopodis TaxID=117903 RepID=A0A448WRE1_9PLAT|nr:unnamed protein product [Protopolystoma xenopodis]